MGRIQDIFMELKGEGRTALMPFLTAGHPSLHVTEATIGGLESAGAHIVELGIPFSDPIADGPVIAAAMHNALVDGLQVDDVIEIIRAESTEDAQRMVGAGKEELVYSTALEKLKGRFPWLFVNLITSSLAAIVVLQFEGLIAEIAILAVLMPVIANQAGNAGQQSLAVTLRGIVLDQVRPNKAMPLILREFLVGVINGMIGGVIVGVVIGIGALLSGQVSWQLGIVAGLAMTAALAIGTITGSSLPIIMRRLGFDPATASTIFLTMVTDSMSFFVFLGLAALMQSWLI